MGEEGSGARERRGSRIKWERGMEGRGADKSLICSSSAKLPFLHY